MKKIKMLIFTVILIGIVGFTNDLFIVQQPSASHYESHTVELGHIKIINTVTGIFESQNVFDIRSGITARISQVFVTEGELITKGKPILKMNCKNIALQIADINLSTKRNLYALTYHKDKRKSVQEIYQLGGRSNKELKELDFKISGIEFDLKGLENDLQKKRLLKDSCIIYSPTAGVISKAKIKPEQFINTGESVVQLIDIKNKILISYVNEFDVRNYSVGQPVEVFLGEYATRGYKGHISVIGEIVKKRSGSNSVKVEFVIEEMADVKIGQQAIVNVEVESFNDVFIVPRNFLVIKGKEVFVNYLIEGKLDTKKINPVGGDYINIGIRDHWIEDISIVKASTTKRL
ncbi:MAG: multidrug resistance efflux pump [Alteromonadaceae bacterium]|jgi:multidrug resistance efflux pump